MVETIRTLQLGPLDAGRRLSHEEFALADYKEPFTYERVQGRLVVMSPAGPEHRGVSRPFRRELGGYWSLHPGVVDDIDYEGWVATSEDDDRIPDICVYLAGESSHLTVPHRVPDVIFEFVSESRADQERNYIHKRAEYHRIGVREYVIVDRFKRSVLVLTWQEGDYAERTLSADDVYTTPLLPELQVELSEVFAA
ncbi:MAG: Uma2 family endonuclease [Planctomycetaceae bacterium]